MAHLTPPADPYLVLGVPRDAGQADIAAAYRVLVRTLHPDTGDADPERFAAVLAAYRLLRDPRRRAAYDRDHPRPADVPIPVKVRQPPPSREPDLRVGPVRRHQRW